MATLNLNEITAWCDSVRRKIASCKPIDQGRADIMEHWERITDEDNREAVLAGTDKDGHPSPTLH